MLSISALICVVAPHATVAVSQVPTAKIEISLSETSRTETFGGRARQIFRCRLRAARLGDEISVTFWLNSEIARRDWRVRILQNRRTIFSEVRRTNAEGNLRVDIMTRNLPGRDTFLGKARDLVAGGLCRVQLQV